MPILPDTTKFLPVDNFGLGGLDVFSEPDDIDNSELQYVRNMYFRDGLLQTRQGSLLYLAKPSGETNAPNQMLVATNSAGLDYMIAVYGTNFYLADTINSQWIKLNLGGSTPGNSGIFYGSTSWNNGTTDDRFYFGNGIDETLKWIMAVDSLSTTTASSDTVLHLNNTDSFPAGGSNIIVMNGSTPVQLQYSSIGKVYTNTTIAFVVSGTTYTITDSASGFVTAGYAIGDIIDVSGTQDNNFTFTITNVAAGTLTVKEETYNESAGATITLTAQGVKTLKLLSGTVGQIIPAGSTVTVPILGNSNVPVGSVFIKSLKRLFVANSQGLENTLNWSVSNNPESFAVSSYVDSGGSIPIVLGKGGILGMADFGEYLLIEKVDTLLQFYFNIASDNSGYLTQVIPVISGDGIGPANKANILNYMNTLYYPTVGEGIVSFSPNQTGSNTASGLSILSSKINNVVTEDLNFSLSRTTGLAQKLYWLCALPTLGVPTNVNNLVLVYDLVRAEMNSTQSAWTIYDNWNAVDIKPVNGNLYYLSANDGAVYETDEGYQDAVAGNVNPYTAVAISKRFSMGDEAMLFRPQYVYLEGLIALGTTFYVNVLANENGSLGTQSYAISGNNSTITSTPLVAGLGVFTLASPMLGTTDLATIQALGQPLFFRVYLEISQAFREHNLTVQMFSVAAGSQWGISQLTLITQPEDSIETALVMSPASAPPVNIQAV